MAKMFWNPTLADERIMDAAVHKLDQIGDAIAAEVKKATPVGTLSRPIYRSGAYAGKWWTSRDAGSLKKSVRATKKGDGRYHNIWIMCGNKKAYYGKIIEHNKPFFRPAWNKGKRIARAILRSGI